MAERVRARILVSGIVQGVFYRQSAVFEAGRLGLAGWVRNLPDGRVEAVAEGRREDVESFVAWCRRGPPAAEVSAVEVSWGGAEGIEGFRIAR